MSNHARRPVSHWRHVFKSSGVCEPLERRVLLAAELVRDIGGVTHGSDPRDVININGTLFFAADDGVSGRELWKSDGTAAGTVRVKDIKPGKYTYAGEELPNSSHPSYLTNVNGTLFFTAYDRASGEELWKSDGTAAGTVRVKGITLRTDQGSVFLTNVNGTLYFTANDGASGYELWKSDGTTAGTVRVKDIFPGTYDYGDAVRPNSSYPAGLTNVNGTLYFTADDGTSGRELWKSNGAAAGTVRVKDINPGTSTSGGEEVPNSSGPSSLTNVNGTLFFAADDGASGRELWKSNGTAAGTVRVKDIFPGTGNYGPNSSSPIELTNVNGTLFFAAEGALWKSNGTAAGTVRVSDDVGAGDPRNITNVNGTLFFISGGLALWKSDGTAAGTVRVKDIEQDTTGGVLYLANVNGTLFFTAYDRASGKELWKSDGTTAGTVRVKDIFPGTRNFGSYVRPDSSFPAGLTNVNGTLYFTADDGTSGRELWKSNGTAAGTQRVKDVNSITASSEPSGMTDVNGTVYFAASDGLTGRELWRTDGTAAGTVRVKDIFPGLDFDGNALYTASSRPSHLTNVNGTLYFAAYDGTSGGELWKSNGTNAGTVRVKDIFPGTFSFYEDSGPNGSDPAQLINLNGTLFFTANDTSGRELWKSDGTTAGTVRVKDIFPGTYDTYFDTRGNSSSPAELTNLNGTLLFTADDGVAGRELWRSDGTSAGTRRLFDIFAGAGSSDPGYFIKVGNVLYFAATTAGQGRELWRSDGTVAGTFRVKDVRAGAAGSYPKYITDVNGTLFFTAFDGASGRELWKSNGTAAGTVRVKDIEPGTLGSSPTGLTNVNGTLYFAADDGASGYELWKSNGTAAGTVRVRNIRAGALGSSPQQLTNVNGTLFFSATDGVGGRELWRSDGTFAGTVREGDIMPGSAGSNPEGLVAVGGKLFFSAETPGKGRELWRATPPARAITSSLPGDGSGDLTATAFRTSGAPIGVEADDANGDDDEEDDHLSGLIS